MSFADHKLIIVTPVYEDVEASSRLFKELAAQFGWDFFVVAVDDGSVKAARRYSEHRECRARGSCVEIASQCRASASNAIGLGYVSEHVQPEQRVVVMDFGWRGPAVHHSQLVGGS